MAKLAKPVGGKKSVKKSNDEAVVSSSSGFISGEEDAATASLKGKGRGRNVKKEIIAEIISTPAQKTEKSPAKAVGTGRGKKRPANEEEKEHTAESEAAPPVEKKPASKGRSKKVAAAAADGEPLVVENGLETVPAKRTRKTPAPKIKEEAVAANGAETLPAAAPAARGKGRGKKNLAVPVVQIGEVAPTQTLEVVAKKRGQKKMSEEVSIKKIQNGGDEVMKKAPIKPVAKNSKAKTAQQQASELPEADVEIKNERSRVKTAQQEASELPEANVEIKNERSRAKILKQEPEKENGAPLEKPKGKQTKAKPVTKRKLNNVETVLEDVGKPSGLEVILEAKEELEKPSPKKKAKKEPKGKKLKEVKPSGQTAKIPDTADQLEGEKGSSAKGAKASELIATDPLKKPKQIKSRAKAAKIPEKATASKIENGIVEKEKPRSRKRGAAAATAATEVNDEIDGAKPAKSKASGKLMNSTVTKYNKDDFILPPGEDGVERFNLKISSWNVAGLRSWLNKDGLRFLEYELPDIFCLQEIKCTTDQMPEEVARIPGYHPYWLCMPGGYAGVAIYSKIMPINVNYGIGNTEFDAVGRMITAEYEKFHLINVYVPNSGRKLVNLEARMRWEKLFQEYVKRLDTLKPVVICGDMNVSHQAIDLANPKSNTRSAGFTQEERDKMTELLGLGFVDTFRHLYPDRTGAYTYWTYMANARSRNVGWRLDYFIVSERFTKRVVDNCIRSQVMGSDHCPITLFLKI